MRCYYDFHIHSCLSPCADDDMTPNNIVNMAKLKGLDVIAITDHNCAKNAEAIMQCGSQAGLLVLPGMEVETAEEVHVVTVFAELQACQEMERLVSDGMPSIRNQKDIFGQQLVCNKKDEVIGEVEHLLVTASSLTIQFVTDQVRRLGGVCFPAHIDRSSYSVISNLGIIPLELDFSCVEVSKQISVSEAFSRFPYIERYRILTSSDAHYLWDISEAEAWLELECLSAQAVISVLNQKRNTI